MMNIQDLPIYQEEMTITQEQQIAKARMELLNSTRLLLTRQEGCVECRPDLFLDGRERKNHLHISARFGDMQFGHIYATYIDGVNVSHRCVECMAGADGFVIISAHPHFLLSCQCGSGEVWLAHLTGNVVVIPSFITVSGVVALN